MLSTSWILPLSLIVLIFAFNWCMPSQPIEPQPPAAGIPITKNEQVEGQPPRTPYNEDEIVQLIKDIYDTYLRLNHIKRWELIWPPNETGHVINETLCQELGLDLAVISLMKRIPYFYDSDTSKNVEFFEYSRAMVYLEDEEVLGDRDPGMFEVQEPRLDHLLRHDIALICTEDEGKNIILDVRENTIRVEDSMDVAPGRDVPPDYEYKPERLDVKNHYRNYYPHHAPTWLASLLEKVRKLEIVPVNYGGHRWLCAGDDREVCYVPVYPLYC
ncbi:hypothetical protein BDV06DRAFT_190998 [Aspergillus oleicola]